MMKREEPGRRQRRIVERPAREEVDEELSFHLEARIREYMERGLDREAARAAALERLGDLRRVRDECAGVLEAERRSDARRRWVRFSWLDVKLGFRLLLRYPGLTLVGGLALAFAIAVGAGAFEAVKQLVNPALPLESGERLVAIQNRAVTTGGVAARALHDFERWRAEAETLEEIGAWRTVERNLIVREGEVEPVVAAELSASAFRVTGVRPLLGRVLEESDERPGAPAVILLSHDTWRARFGAAPDVVGRTVRLDDAQVTVIGVMPAGFGFPVAHRAWLPFRLDALEHAPGEGPQIGVFGRLAPGVTLERAQAELAAIGRRAALAFPDTHEQLRPEVVPYAKSIVTLDVAPELRPLFYAVNLVFVMLLVLVAANIALLMFARAASREGEIVVRTALGASRGRIAAQLFAEALVLGTVAAAVGLLAARLALAAWLRVSTIEWEGRLPFWLHDRIAPSTVAYALGLTVLGAIVSGCLPALKMTGRGVETRLRQLAAGSGGPRFGGIWTAVIVAQVAVAVTFPATAFFARRYVVQTRSLDLGIPSGEYLTARLEMEPSSGRSFRVALRELERRLENEPDVLGVAFTERLPRTHHPAFRMEVDDGTPSGDVAPGAPARVSTARIAPDYFDVLGAAVLAGRSFRATDAEADARVVIVNRSFVASVLGGGNAIGRRVRYAALPGREPGPWHEIVGVVPDLGMVDDVSGGVGLYHPAPPDTSGPVHLAMHVRGDPGAIAPRLRGIAAAVEPSLRLHQIVPLDEASATMWLETAFLYRILVGISAVALLLSLAGIYAVTSFTVARRTREIGIRVALGADARRVIVPIFARPLAQVGAGVIAGGCMTAALAHGALRGALGPAGIALVVAYAAGMMGVCLLACAVPTRRALRIPPGEALRIDG